jgi:multidrug transporter EmrE-like cation transporter
MPTVYSVVLLKGQSMTAIQIAGFFLLVVSVVLLAASKKTTQTSGKASWKWLLWMIPMFITNSIINFASRLQIYLTGSGESFSYTALCYGFSFLLCVFSFFALGGLKVTGKEKVKHYFLPAFCLALSLGANMLAHLRLPALNIPAAIQYPVISGSSTILAMIVGITVFHEKIRFYGYFAIAGGIAAMVLLNM